MSTREIKVPHLGESVSSATITQWFKKVGDSFKENDVLLELETDKVTLEVNAPADGTLQQIARQENDTVNIGDVVGVMVEGQSTETLDASHGQESTPEKESSSKDASQNVQPTQSDAHSQETQHAQSDEHAQETQQPQNSAPKSTNATQSPPLKDAPSHFTENLAAHISGYAQTSQDHADAPSSPSGQAPSVTSQTNGSSAAFVASENGPLASPAAQHYMGQHNIDPHHVTPSGKHGVILKEDVAAQKPDADQSDAHRNDAQDTKTRSENVQAPPPFDTPTQASLSGQGKTGEMERKPMSPLRKKIAERLKHAQNTAAILTTFNECDMSAVMQLRRIYQDAFMKKHDVKLGFMSFFIKACAQALKEIPAVNGEIDGSDIIYHKRYDIGVAVSAPQGLIVPVIRGVDAMSCASIEKAIIHYGEQAKANKISLKDLSGGTFTISNGGTFGSLCSTPILNPPQSAILGMHKIQERAVVVDGHIVVRPMMHLALSYDHRIIDGKEAVTFLVKVKNFLENPGMVLLDL